MKTPQEWALETNSFSLMGWEDYVQFIEDIQRDALSDPLASATDQQELAMAKSAALNERIRADQLHDQLLEMRERWLEARRYLRAANKGAERNAIALSLATERNIRYRKLNEELQMGLSMEKVNRAAAAACFQHEAHKNEYLKLAHEKSIQEDSLQESRQKETGEL